jgi:putative aldouronate transport system substrate-binding protein
MKKRTIGLVLCALFLFAGSLVFAGGRRDTASGGKLVITVTQEGNANTHDSTVERAYQELIAKKLGREIEIRYTMIPGSDYSTKAQLLLATGDLTDFFQIPFLYDYSRPVQEGFFTNLLPQRAKLSNYFNYIERADGGLANVLFGDGGVYVIAGIGLPRFPEDHGILPNNTSTYRYDIFQKHGIPIPETLDDIYNAAKKLKSLYPSVYPINSRWRDLRSLFFSNHTQNTIYWNGSAYVNGLFEEGYKEAIAFAQKLYTEGLLDPEYIIDTDDTLKSKELTDRTFIVLSDWFTTPGEFTRLSETGQIFCTTFFADNPKYGRAWQNIQRVNSISTNVFYNAAISSKVKDLDGVLAFLNASYEDDVVRLLNWGIEGTTYTLDANGNPRFVDSILNANDPWIEADKYGMRASRNMRPGLSLVDDAIAFVGLAPNDWLYYNGDLHVEPIEKSPYYLSFPYPKNEYMPPFFDEPRLIYTEAENEIRSQNMARLETYRNEMEAKFISGEERMANWDAYMNGIRSICDVDALLKVMNDAARRYLSNL